MANKSAVLYQTIKIKNKWTTRRAEGTLRNLTEGVYYVVFYRGAERCTESAGRNAKEALDLLKRKQVELLYVAQGGHVSTPLPAAFDPGAAVAPPKERKSLKEAIKEYLEDCRDRQGKSGYGMAPRTVETYSGRLPLLLEYSPEAYMDEIDLPFVRGFRRFLRNHPKDFSDRTAVNIMQAVNTFLIWHGNHVAKPILKEMSFEEKPVRPYTEDHIRAFFAVCTKWEEILFKLFLHSMGRDMEVAHLMVRDLNFEKSVIHFSPKPDLGFRLKGKRSGQAKMGRRIPIPAAYMAKLKNFCEGKKSNDLVFPNRNGGVQTHFLDKCKRIAKRAELRDWDEFNLHRWRKTCATSRHEDGASVRKIQSWLGHESLEVTLAYLGVEDAADEVSQEQVNSGALAGYV